MKSLKKIAKRKSVPQYTLVMEDIINKIHDGIYRPGAKIESVRELAARFGIGRQVSHYALEQLVRQNYLYCEAKRGVYVNPALKSGLFYRVGVFSEKTGPLGDGQELDGLFSTFMEHGFQLIYSTSDQEIDSLERFLKRNPKIDGLIVKGQVTEDFLKSLKQAAVPYVVLGNYAIAPEHPQVRVNVEEIVYSDLKPRLDAWRGKKGAALMGDDSFEADREAIAGMRRAFADAGVELVSGVSCKSGDGYAEISAILEKGTPDVLFIMGVGISGYRKYLRIHKPEVKPHVIANIKRPNFSNDVVSEAICCPLCTMQTATLAAEKLLSLLDAEH